MTHTHLGLEALEDRRHHLPHLLQKKTAGVRRLDEVPARKEEDRCSPSDWTRRRRGKRKAGRSRHLESLEVLELHCSSTQGALKDIAEESGTLIHVLVTDFSASSSVACYHVSAGCF